MNGYYVAKPKEIEKKKEHIIIIVTNDAAIEKIKATPDLVYNLMGKKSSMSQLFLN